MPFECNTNALGVPYESFVNGVKEGEFFIDTEDASTGVITGRFFTVGNPSTAIPIAGVCTPGTMSFARPAGSAAEFLYVGVKLIVPSPPANHPKVVMGKRISQQNQAGAVAAVAADDWVGEKGGN